MFEAPLKLGLGLFTGIFFGFFLQKGRVAKFSVIVGQLLLREWTVVKVMLSAVAVGSVGVYALVSLGVASLHVKPTVFAGVIFGGLLFGAGLAVFGYCPGTSVAASGEGSKDAMVGVAGMLFGALNYVWFYPVLKQLLATWPDWGKMTLPELTSTSPWLWVLGLLAIATAMYSMQLRGQDQRKSPSIFPSR